MHTQIKITHLGDLYLFQPTQVRARCNWNSVELFQPHPNTKELGFRNPRAMHCFAEQWKYSKIFSRRKDFFKKINNSFLNELLLATLLPTWKFSKSWASNSFQDSAECLHARVFPEIKFGVFVLGVFKSLPSQEIRGVLGGLPNQPQVDNTIWFSNILDLPRG